MWFAGSESRSGRNIDDDARGEVLYEFLAADAILDLAEAILRVFHRLGDFKHKQRNRMKFLVKTLRWTRFRAEVDEEFARIREAGGARLPFDPDRPPVEEAPIRAYLQPRPHWHQSRAARLQPSKVPASSRSSIDA